MKNETQLLGTRAEIYHKAFKAIRFAYPYATYEMQSNLAHFIEEKINRMDFDINAMYKEWMGA